MVSPVAFAVITAAVVVSIPAASASSISCVMRARPFSSADSAAAFARAIATCTDRCSGLRLGRPRLARWHRGCPQVVRAAARCSMGC